MADVTLQGQPVRLNGQFPETGSKAPEFSLTDQKLKEVALNRFQGQSLLIYTVPSLDTPVCAKSSRRLSQLADSRSDIACLVVSADLPFAMGRFCGSEKIKNLLTLSNFRSPGFAADYGIEIGNGPLAGLLARALFVVDDSGQIVYAKLSDEIAEEPDFDAALAALES